LAIDHKEERMANYELLPFLKDIGCSDMQFKLLCFWGRHPRAKLTLRTIAGALDISNNSLRVAMKTLEGKGILKVQHNGNGLTTYALSQQYIQEYIDELGRLDYSKMIDLGKQLKEKAISPLNNRE